MIDLILHCDIVIVPAIPCNSVIDLDNLLVIVLEFHCDIVIVPQLPFNIVIDLVLPCDIVIVL